MIALPTMKRFYLLNQLDIVQPDEGEDEQAFIDSMLGRVVKSYQEPGRNYVAVARVADNAAALKARRTVLDDWNQAVSTTRSLSLKLTLEKIFGVEQEASRSGQRDVETKKTFHHFFANSDDAIKQVRGDAGVKARLREWLARGGARAWLVVGVVTAHEAEIADGGAVSHSTKASVTVPNPAAPGLDAPIQVEAAHDYKVEQHGRGKASTLSVIAVEYQCLRRRMFARGPEPVTEVRRGPQGPNAFGPGDDDEGEGGNGSRIPGGWDFDVVDAPITDILEAEGRDDLEHEDFGSFSLAFNVDDDDDDDEEEDDDEE